MVTRFSRLAVVAVSVCALACSRQEPDVTCDAGRQQVSLDISLQEPYTRVTDTAGEDEVESLQVFVFGENGVLEAYASDEAATVSLTCTVGQKFIAAVVNAPRIQSVSDRAALEEAVSSLEDNAPGKYVMYGYSQENIVASTTVTVEVSRLVARVSIDRITNAFTLEQYRNAEFKVERIYLINVAGDALYTGGGTPSVWFNRRSLSSEMASLLSSGDLGESIAYGESYEQAHYFYCYPNPTRSDTHVEQWSPRYTRLVIETTLGGETYYYPISIQGIESNHKYEISELKITRPGSSHPDIPVSLEDMTFEIIVSDWEPGTSGTVEI